MAPPPAEPAAPTPLPASAAARVAYLIPEFPGQTHIWMWREIEHLRQAGVEIALFSTRRPPARDRARHAFADSAEAETTYLWPPRVRALPGDLAWALARPRALAAVWKLAFTLPVTRRPAARTLLPLIPAAIALARAVERRGLERLHSHTCSNSAVLAMMASRLTGRPYSLTLNANVEWWGGAMAQKFGRAEFTAAITRWLHAQVRDEFPQLRDDQLVLGRIGVDTLKWRPAGDASESAPRAPSGPLRILSVGRLHFSKGYDDLLHAVDRLGGAGVDARLTLIGDGPDAAALREQVRELGLGDRVSLTGSLSEDAIIEHLRRADVFVLSSHAEPLGVVLMEAMAMEVAVIGTDAGGVGEIITHGLDGLLVPPRDPAALARALGELAQDPARRSRLARVGRRRVIDAFDSRRGAATLYTRFTGRDAAPMLAPLHVKDPVEA